jgi:hypothetical protein
LIIAGGGTSCRFVAGPLSLCQLDNDLVVDRMHGRDNNDHPVVAPERPDAVRPNKLTG